MLSLSMPIERLIVLLIFFAKDGAMGPEVYLGKTSFLRRFKEF